LSFVNPYILTFFVRFSQFYAIIYRKIKKLFKKMARKEGKMDKVAVERGETPRISSERFREYLRKVSPEALERRHKRQERMIHLRRQEDVSRREENEYVLGPLEARLGISKKNAPREGNILDEKEQEAVLRAIEESGDADPDELRETFVYSLKSQEIFKEQYAKWQSVYLSDPRLQSQMTFEDYVHEQGIRFIRENRKLLIRSRVNRFNKMRVLPSGRTEEQRRETDEKIYREIDMFVQANYDKMASYSTLDDKDKDVLFAKFWLRMQENGVDIGDRKKVRELFLLIVGDVEYEAIAIQDYDATYTEMSQNVSLNLSNEEWEERRFHALRKKAKGQLQEVAQEQKPVQAKYTPVNYMQTSSYYSVSEVAHQSGVNLRPAAGKGENVYEVVFPQITDKTFRPLLRIVYPKGKAGKVDDAVFVLQEPWTDKDSKTGRPIEAGAGNESVPTREYRPNEMHRAMNVLMLDYIMNKGIRTTEEVAGNPGINDIIKDNDMVYMAERLFGFRLDDEKKRILEPEIQLFRRFISVLIRSDGKTSLEQRVLKVKKEVLVNDSMIPYFRETLGTEGAKTKTLDECIEETKARREGRIK
jgi:hypothetical protein